MTTEWTELNTLQDVAQAQKDGWEIEFYTGTIWVTWHGNYWSDSMTYRGRPKNETKETVEMTTEWKDLVTMREVAEAQHNGWEIQTEVHPDEWWKWHGKTWDKDRTFRGRPAKPKMKTVTSECWRNMKTGSLGWAEPMSNAFVAADWRRFPAGDHIGEVEV